MTKQSGPFITDSQRTALCAANELTATGSNSPQFPQNLTDEQMLRALVAAAKDMASAPGPDDLPPSPPPVETDTANKKKEGCETDESEGERLAEPFPARRSRLPSAIKVRMVELFAQFSTVSEVRDHIKDEFGHDIDLRTVGMYNPQVKSATIGKRLREHYEACRKHYVERSTDMALAHQAHRLRMLGRIAESAIKSRDYAAANKALELAAKETQPDKPTVVEHRGTVSHVHGTVEEARAEVAMRLAAMVEAHPMLTLPAAVEDVATTPAPPAP